MENLNNKKCVPCQGGTPPMTTDEIKKYLPQIKADWEVLDSSSEMKVDGLGKKLRKEFKFKDFKEAMIFVNKVADICEQEGHHANIYIDYNRVELTLWTHKIVGLHENDFILASKIDNI